MDRSIHDNFVTGYSVDCALRTITIHTEYRDQGEPFERTDVRFEGVVGYLFRDNLRGILFDIEVDTMVVSSRNSPGTLGGEPRTAGRGHGMVRRKTDASTWIGFKQWCGAYNPQSGSTGLSSARPCALKLANQSMQRDGVRLIDRAISSATQPCRSDSRAGACVVRSEQSR